MSKNWLVALVCVFVCFAGTGLSGQHQSECATISQALRSAQLITPGVKRQQVEEAFSLDGGASFRTATVYVSKICPMLKIKVEFVPSTKAPGAASNPEDIVSNVSTMYVEWPVRD
jgi:hypothetical protein